MSRREQGGGCEKNVQDRINFIFGPEVKFKKMVKLFVSKLSDYFIDVKPSLGKSWEVLEGLKEDRKEYITTFF